MLASSNWPVTATSNSHVTSRWGLGSRIWCPRFSHSEVHCNDHAVTLPPVCALDACRVFKWIIENSFKNNHSRTLASCAALDLVVPAFQLQLGNALPASGPPESDGFDDDEVQPEASRVLGRSNWWSTKQDVQVRGG